MYRNTRGESFGAECKRRISWRRTSCSYGYYDVYYLKAQKIRNLHRAVTFREGVRERGRDCRARIPFPAFKLGEKVNDPLQMYLSDIFTITGSLAGIPCMSVTCGNDWGGTAGRNAGAYEALRRNGDVPPRARIRERGLASALNGKGPPGMGGPRLKLGVLLP